MKKSMKTGMMILFAFTTMLTVAQTKPIEIEKKWELDGFNNPESILFDEINQVLYVSNVNGAPTDKDQNGFISKVSLDGKIIQLKWVDGLSAPKGMVIVKGKLYVTDITDIVEINIAQAKKTNTYHAEGSTFLNDLTADKQGNVYASNTFGFSAIYQLNTKGNILMFMKDEGLQMPNGLLVDGKNLLVASWGIGFDPATYQTQTPGSLLSVSLKNKKLTTLSQPMGNLDGLEKTVHGYLLTDWLAGKLFYFMNGAATELLDLPQGSADIEFDKTSKTIFIPLMNDNKIIVYAIKK